MLVRLRDFAELHRISERTVQVHIKDNWDELEGHIDRRGKQGTWLDEFAVEYLLERIQLPTKDEVLMPTPREAALLLEVAETNKKLADAERRAGENAEAAGKVLYLEAAKAAQDEQIANLAAEKGKAEERARVASAAARTAQGKLETAHERERLLKDYAAALERWSSLGWWARRKEPKPVMPELPKEDDHEENHFER